MSKLKKFIYILSVFVVGVPQIVVDSVKCYYER